ncbi:phosphotransferase [Vibrio profundum]
MALKQEEDFSPVRMKRWGQLITELHDCTIDYQVPENIEKRPDWDNESNYLRISSLCDEKHEFYSKFNLLNNWLRQLPKDPEVYNLVHADIHHNNFFVNQSNDLTLIDFDDCHFHWFLYDLAVPIFHLSILLREQCLPSELDVLIKHMVESYTKTRKLAPYHLEALDNFVLLRHFVLYFWATHNLMQPSFNDSTKEWIKMAINYCSAHINQFDYSQLTMPSPLYQELSSSVT